MEKRYSKTPFNKNSIAAWMFWWVKKDKATNIKKQQQQHYLCDVTEHSVSGLCHCQMQDKDNQGRWGSENVFSYQLSYVT